KKRRLERGPTPEEERGRPDELDRWDIKKKKIEHLEAVDILKKYDKDQARNILEKVLALQKSPQDKFKLEELQKELNISKPKFFALVRMTLIDNDTGPPIVELYSFFKPQEIHRRFEDMYNMLS
uniref:Uncharacterized protein n=1 Tax=Acrobeloides nanus TaxID=290746 RepID=A0A914D7H6_9BILA